MSRMGGDVSDWSIIVDKHLLGDERLLGSILLWRLDLFAGVFQ